MTRIREDRAKMMMDKKPMSVPQLKSTVQPRTTVHASKASKIRCF